MYTDTFKDLVATYRATDIEFNQLKPVSLAMWILESARGDSGLARQHLNFAGMKYRSEITEFCKRVTYEAHDGPGYYCEFPDLSNFIAGYWAFLDRSPYDGWRDVADDPEAFIRHIGGVWAEDPAYIDKVLSLIPEATGLLDTGPGAVGDDAEEGDDGSTSTLLLGRPTVTISADGKRAVGSAGLDIIYRGDDNCPYGKTASAKKKPFAGIVIHHTSPKHTTEWYVQYQIDGDPARGGHFGYHFYISPAGVIYQGAPLTKRTNQVSPKSSVRREFGKHIQNVNSIGITCARAGLAAGFSPTDEQKDQVRTLVFALCDALDISFKDVVGHGEVQTNRHKTEGRSLSEEIRDWTD